MGNRKTNKRPSNRLENIKDPKKKSLDVSEKYSESLIALNESSFKIRRFMNDVSTYKEYPSTKTKKTKHESEYKDKEYAYPKSSLATKKAKNSHENRGKGDGESKTKFAGKKGLFENGVATKARTSCRGLMPPMWNARLNADLRSILNLACVDAPKRHATSHSVAEPIDDAFESLLSRSPDATLINSRLAKRIEKKKSPPKRSKKPDLQSIFNDGDVDDESLVHASCSQVGAAEPAAAESEVASRAGSEDASAVGAKSADVVDAVNFSDYYLRFTHCIIKSLSETRFDREELENTSKKPVRFLAEFYRERLAQALEEQKGEDESPSFLPRDVFQNKENVQRSQPTSSQPVQYGANTIRSDEWPRISRMKAQADEQFLDDSVVRKSKTYTSGLELLEAVYGSNNDDNQEKAYNHLSVTPPKCVFSPVAAGDIASNCSSFVNPVSGKKDWLPDFKCFSPPETKSCMSCDEVVNNNCDFMTCDDDSCRNNVINYDFMTCGDGRNVRNCDFISGINRRGCSDGRSCFLNDATVRNCDRRVENTLDRNSRSGTAFTTADCLTILPPKSRRLDEWRTSGLRTGIKVEDGVDDTEDLLTLPLRPPARQSPDIQYYPRRMF